MTDAARIARLPPAFRYAARFRPHDEAVGELYLSILEWRAGLIEKLF